MCETNMNNPIDLNVKLKHHKRFKTEIHNRMSDLHSFLMKFCGLVDLSMDLSMFVCKPSQ